MVQNKSLIFKKVPDSTPVAGEHLAIEDRPLDLSKEPPKDGLLVQNLYFSFDPYQRGRMRDSKIESYSPAYAIGEPIRNSAIAKVLKSANSKFSENDLITIYMEGQFQEYSVLSADEARENVWKLNNRFDLTLDNFLGPLGMPGLTAFSGFYEIGQPKERETIFISAASGAVGSMVGQLAKREGLTVIGSVGDDAKLKYILDDLGFDKGFNYKKEAPSDALKRLAPNGLDIYFESVGGPSLEAALVSMKNFGRIGT
jgi:NADPH-dependent curcumin reductase CurA